MTKTRKHTLALGLTAAAVVAALSLAARAGGLDRHDDQAVLAQADSSAEFPVAESASDGAEPTPDFAQPEKGDAAEVPDLGSNDDLIAKYEALKDAYESRDEASSALLAWSAIVAAFAWLLIAAIKRLGNLTDRGKQWLPLVALGLGVIAGGAASIAEGIPWWQALVVGAGGPLSVFVHELLKRGKGGSLA